MRLLAESRADEALALLGLGHNSGAYYLAGYAIECGLKAVLTRSLASHTLPHYKAAEKVHIHRLGELMSMTGLTPAIAADRVVGPSWIVVQSWSEQARYRLYDVRSATDMVVAATDPTSGVLQWLKRYW